MTGSQPGPGQPSPAAPGPSPTPPPGGPPSPTPSGGPTLFDVLVVLVLAYVLGGVASSEVRAQLDGALADAVALASFGVAMGVLAVGWIAVRHGVSGLRAVLGPPPSLLHLGAAVTVGAAAGVLLNVALPPVMEVLLDQVGLDPPTVQQTHRRVLTAPDSRLAAAAGVLVIAPLGEELLFRGLAFRALRRRLAAATAVAASAVLFAGMHVLDTDALGAAFLLVTLGTVGALLAVLVERQRHVWGAVVAHAVFNGVGVGVILTA